MKSLKVITLTACLVSAVSSTLAPVPAHADEAGQIVVIDGRRFQILGSATSAGTGPTVSGTAVPGSGELDLVLETVHGISARPPVCKPSPSPRVEVVDVVGYALLELATGDIWYRWNAATLVDVPGTCDETAISRQAYIDAPLVPFAMGGPEYGGPYEARSSGPVLQSPDFFVRYYDTLVFGRALVGSLTVTVNGSYVEKGTGITKFAGCATRTVTFVPMQTGPQEPYLSDTGSQPCTPAPSEL